MGFLSSIFQSDRRNVRDLLLAEKVLHMPEADRQVMVEGIITMLNHTEQLDRIAASSEICDLVMLRRINKRSKIEKFLLSNKQKPFVFLVCRN